MRVFFKVFFGILLICVFLAAASYGISFLASRFDTILSPKETSVNNAAGKKSVIVVIDAGHGGMDGGAVGTRGTLEKDLNLDVAQKLSTALTNAGVANILTRSDDNMLTSQGASSAKNGDIRARLNITESTENAILVSIHMNKFSDPLVKGMTFYYSPNHPEGRVLAEAMKAVLVDKLQPENKRPIKEAGSSIYLLNRTTKPAVLVECGFLSNSYEEALLLSEEYRQRVADILCEALLSYLDQNPNRESNS